MVLASSILAAACSHPLEIVGEGDIESSTQKHDCALEEQPCANFVTGDYRVTYVADPRPGWVFTGWDGCAGQFPLCEFDVPADQVERFAGQTMPPLRAMFAHAAVAPHMFVATDWSASSGLLTVEVTFTDFSPSRVQLFPAGLAGDWIEEDAAAPFVFTLDSTRLEPGMHVLRVVADDGAEAISDTAMFAVPGCNGRHDLCDRRFDEVRYATTHNAMSSSARGWSGPNQAWDVPTQLAMGVRGLMLDTYRAGDLNLLGLVQVPDVDPDSAYLCHSICAIGKQPLVEGLAEIRAFLDDNPGAVVTLILESYLSHSLTAAAFDAAGLTPYAYVHDGGAWPTLGQMIDAGSRLVVLQDVAVNPAYPWLMNVWTHAFETHFSASVPEDFSCADNRGTPGSDLFIFNHFLTDVFGSPALAEQVNHNPLLQERIAECELTHGAIANFVTVDFVDIGDVLTTIDELN